MKCLTISYILPSNITSSRDNRILWHWSNSVHSLSIMAQIIHLWIKNYTHLNMIINCIHFTSDLLNNLFFFRDPLIQLVHIGMKTFRNSEPQEVVWDFLKHILHKKSQQWLGLLSWKQGCSSTFIWWQNINTYLYYSSLRSCI